MNKLISNTFLITSIALAMCAFGSCVSEKSNPVAKDDKAASSVMIYEEGGQVRKSEFTEYEKKQMEKLKYTPPPSEHGEEHVAKNKDLYAATLKKYTSGSLGAFMLVEDFYDPIKILLIVNQNVLVQVMAESTGIQNPHNLEDAAIK